MFSLFVLAAATAVSTALPVQLHACSISPPVAIPQSGDQGGFETIGGYRLHVRFTNLATEPITKVVFALSDGTPVSDTGSFSPGAFIDHTLPLDATSATACAVTSVVFADGTSLRQPDSVLHVDSEVSGWRKRADYEPLIEWR